jgi:hypothetical protein
MTGMTEVWQRDFKIVIAIVLDSLWPKTATGGFVRLGNAFRRIDNENGNDNDCSARMEMP